MKNVVDLFIVKDRTAIFWFTMACASIFCSAIYVKTVIAAVQKKPQYVIMDGTGVYYLAPSVELEGATELHIAQTRLAMETIYNRTPRGLVFKSRVDRLFTPEGVEKVNAEFKAEASRFSDEQRTQTVDVYEEPRVIKVMPSIGQLVTEAKGRITRSGTFKGQKKTEILYVTNRFVWKMNARMAHNQLFPTACFNMKLAEPSSEPKPFVP